MIEQLRRVGLCVAVAACDGAVEAAPVDSEPAIETTPVNLFVRVPGEACFRFKTFLLDRTYWGDWPAAECDDGPSMWTGRTLDDHCVFMPRDCGPYDEFGNGLPDDPWLPGSGCNGVRDCGCTLDYFYSLPMCEDPSRGLNATPPDDLWGCWPGNCGYTPEPPDPL